VAQQRLDRDAGRRECQLVVVGGDVCAMSEPLWIDGGGWWDRGLLAVLVAILVYLLWSG
jgi:hypothetical protein